MKERIGASAKEEVVQNSYLYSSNHLRGNCEMGTKCVTFHSVKIHVVG